MLSPGFNCKSGNSFGIYFHVYNFSSLIIQKTSLIKFFISRKPKTLMSNIFIYLA